MKKSVALGVFVGVFVLLIVSAWLLNTQFDLRTQIADLQTKIIDLHMQNNELHKQVNDLQNQTNSLQSHNYLLVNQLGDLTKQLALERPLRIEIVSLSHDEDWFPFAGLTVAYRFNVTIRNSDVVTVSGLNLTVKMYLGNEEAGWADWGSLGSETALLNPGEEKLFGGYAMEYISTPSNLTYVATLKSGDVVLDEFTSP